MSRAKRSPGVCEFETTIRENGKRFSLSIYINVDRLATALVKSASFKRAVKKANDRDAYRGMRIGKGVVFELLALDVD